MKQDYLKIISLLMISLIIFLPLSAARSYAGLSNPKAYGSTTPSLQDVYKPGDTINIEVDASIEGDSDIALTQVLYWGRLTETSFYFTECQQISTTPPKFKCSYTPTNMYAYTNPQNINIYLYDDNRRLNDSKTIIINKDETPPEVTFTATSTPQSTTLSYTIIDTSCPSCAKCSGIKKLDVRSQEKGLVRTYNINTASCSYHSVVQIPTAELTSSPGSFSLVLTAYDAFNQIATANQTLSLDTVKPIIINDSLSIIDQQGNSVSEIPPGGVAANISIDIQELGFSYAKADLISLGLGFTNADSCIEVSAGLHRCFWSKLINVNISKSYNLKFEAYDNANNKGEASLFYYLGQDNLKPVVKVIKTENLIEGKYYLDNNDKITAIIQEAGSGFDDKNIFLDISSIINNSNNAQADSCSALNSSYWSCYWDVNNQNASGEHLIFIRPASADDAGNTVTGLMTQRVIVDLNYTAPDSPCVGDECDDETEDDDEEEEVPEEGSEEGSEEEGPKCPNTAELIAACDPAWDPCNENLCSRCANDMSGTPGTWDCSVERLQGCVTDNACDEPPIDEAEIANLDSEIESLQGEIDSLEDEIDTYGVLCGVAEMLGTYNSVVQGIRVTLDLMSIFKPWSEIGGIGTLARVWCGWATNINYVVDNFIWPAGYIPFPNPLRTIGLILKYSCMIRYHCLLCDSSEAIINIASSAISAGMGAWKNSIDKRNAEGRQDAAKGKIDKKRMETDGSYKSGVEEWQSELDSVLTLGGDTFRVNPNDGHVYTESGEYMPGYYYDADRGEITYGYTGTDFETTYSVDRGVDATTGEIYGYRDTADGGVERFNVDVESPLQADTPETLATPVANDKPDKPLSPSPPAPAEAPEVELPGGANGDGTLGDSLVRDDSVAPAATPTPAPAEAPEPAGGLTPSNLFADNRQRTADGETPTPPAPTPAPAPQRAEIGPLTIETLSAMRGSEHITLERGLPLGDGTDFYYDHDHASLDLLVAKSEAYPAFSKSGEFIGWYFPEINEFRRGEHVRLESPGDLTIPQHSPPKNSIWFSIINFFTPTGEAWGETTGVGKPFNNKWDTSSDFKGTISSYDVDTSKWSDKGKSGEGTVLDDDQWTNNPYKCKEFADKCMCAPAELYSLEKEKQVKCALKNCYEEHGGEGSAECIEMSRMLDCIYVENAKAKHDGFKFFDWNQVEEQAYLAIGFLAIEAVMIFACSDTPSFTPGTERCIDGLTDLGLNRAAYCGLLLASTTLYNLYNIIMANQWSPRNYDPPVLSTDYCTSGGYPTEEEYSNLWYPVDDELTYCQEHGGSTTNPTPASAAVQSAAATTPAATTAATTPAAATPATTGTTTTAGVGTTTVTTSPLLPPTTAATTSPTTTPAANNNAGNIVTSPTATLQAEKDSTSTGFSYKVSWYIQATETALPYTITLDSSGDTLQLTSGTVPAGESETDDIETTSTIEYTTTTLRYGTRQITNSIALGAGYDAVINDTSYNETG